MAAFVLENRVGEFNAEFVHQHVVGRKGFFGEGLDLFGIVHVKAGFEHVLRHLLRGVFDALDLLYFRARHAHDAAVDDRVAAGRRHFFQNDDFAASFFAI